MFGYYLSEAFSGAADTDRNLRITADELSSYLGEQMPAAQLPGGKQQVPFNYRP
ncbi:MAG: hypothetical protein R3B90_06095 [Planctomycetaceae bacterium]